MTSTAICLLSFLAGILVGVGLGLMFKVTVAARSSAQSVANGRQHQFRS